MKSKIIMIVIMLFIIVGFEALFSFNDTDYTVTITDKERVIQGSGDSTTSKYLVYADGENGESLVFENTDCIIRGKWNSSNIQGKLKAGHTYKITVVGYRVPFMSWYQNIIKVSEKENNPTADQST